jgi:hypothetical protein
MVTVFVILVVSDATGETAERMVRSALAQFPGAQVNVVRHAQVRSADQVRDVALQAAAEGAVVFHTLVSTELRRLMLAECRIHGVDAMDLMGPVLDRLARHLSVAPQEQPGLFKQLVEATSRQIEAVEFAFRHDDGKRYEDLADAEIVLVGVSRTMKTPTTLFLAYHGWFAANVPIVPGTPLPPPLAGLPSGRIFCLLMSAGRLAELRRSRAEHLGIPLDPYAAVPAVREELRHSERVALEHGWRLLDVTGKSVEEVAGEIVSLVGSELIRPAPTG